ncbi:uncharacterized protein PG998_013067 [Apiospora kogelbergensis]|uniref:uncharacterized protein n=1 Tax=Apiospora kogelbergensis TaxID=1337665 RepID=UPI003131EED8
MRLRHLVLAGVMATSGTLGLDMSSCVRSCYAATVYFLGCNPDDVACVCKQQPNLMYYAEPCLAQECRDDNLLLALKSMKDLCSSSSGGGGGASPTKTPPPPATQSPAGSFSYKVGGSPPQPTTIAGATVVASGGAATRTLEPITIAAQQSPIPITPPGAGAGAGAGAGSSVESSRPGKGGAGGSTAGTTTQGSGGGAVAWRRGRWGL